MTFIKKAKQKAQAEFNNARAVCDKKWNEVIGLPDDLIHLNEAELNKLAPLRGQNRK